MQRRSVLTAGAAASLNAFGGRVLAAGKTTLATHTSGCCLADRDAPGVFAASNGTAVYNGNETLMASGNPNFDRALVVYLADIAKRFDVLPAFGFYDDATDGTNAYATPQIEVADRADGTVFFGTALMKFLLDNVEDPEVVSSGICAHEFGHVIQFKYGLLDKVNAGQPTIKRSELQADYFAGYYAGLKKLDDPKFPAALVALMLHSFGETLTTFQHHGTPEERGAAVATGFKASFYGGKSLSDAISESTSYVLGL